MLQLHTTATDDRIVVTLEEDRSIESPWYHFVFTHMATKEEVKFAVEATTDLSSYKRRFNEFEIDTATLFADAKAGQYTYDVYEAETDEWEEGLNLLETGRALLVADSSTSFTGSNATSTFKGYGG
jgi:hypothetical protein